jgi:hypothetical protein
MGTSTGCIHVASMIQTGLAFAGDELMDSIRKSGYIQHLTLIRDANVIAITSQFVSAYQYLHMIAC